MRLLSLYASIKRSVVHTFVATGAALVGSALLAVPASAIPLIGNLPGNDATFTLIPVTWKAMGFTTPSSGYAVESVDLRLRLAEPGEPIIVQLFATNAAGTAPATTDGASPLATFLNPAFTTPALPTTYNFTLTTPFTLASATTYWIVVRGEAGAEFSWLASNPSVTPTSSVGITHAGAWFIENNGATYSVSTVLNSYQLNGSAQAAAAPEPATFALLTLGVMISNFAARKIKGQD